MKKIIKKYVDENVRENSKEIMVDESGNEYKKMVVLDLDSVIRFEWRKVI
jgi:membrane glycosyltransferase